MNLLLQPLNPRRGTIYALLTLAEASWIAPVLLGRIAHHVTDVTGWFLLLATITGLVILLGWLTDTYQIPFAAARTAGMVLAGLAILLLLHATLYPVLPFWRFAWVGQFFVDLAVVPGQLMSLGWIVLAVAYLWWRCLFVGYTLPEPDTAQFTFKTGITAFAIVLLLGSFQPQPAPPFLLLFLFVCTSLPAMSLSYTQTISLHHNQAAVGRWQDRLVNSGSVVPAVWLLAIALGLVITLPMLNQIFSLLGSLLGVLLKPLGGILIWLVTLLDPFLQGLVDFLHRSFAQSGMFEVTPVASVTPEPPLAETMAQTGPVWWAVYTIWAWRVAAIAVVVWLFYWFTGRMGMWYRPKPPETDLAVTPETLSPEALNPEGLFEAGKRRLAELINLVKRFGLGRELRAAVTIRRMYAAMIALAAQQGVIRAPAQTPLEFLPVLADCLPELADPCGVITRAYVGVHYGQLPEEESSLREVRAAWEVIYRALAEK